MKNSKLLKRLLLIITSMTMMLAAVLFPTVIKAEDEDDPLIVVSMGDSYSSGEGIEPFFGQNEDISRKVTNPDWLAHRSELSWASQLKFNGLVGTLGNYRSDYPYYPTGPSNARWYFVASSGATTDHFKHTQKKHIKRDFYDLDAYLPPQLDIFAKCRGEVDYVTFSIGGNDVHFKDVIVDAVAGSTYLNLSGLKKRLDNEWNDIEQTKTKIRNAYKSVFYNAGPQVKLLIPGYPKLVDRNGHGATISLDEAIMINDSVTRFNYILSSLVNEADRMGLGEGAYFIDIESKFDGHEAYSSGLPYDTGVEWINRVILLPQEQDLEKFLTIGSSYSVHPNEKGAHAYAECINEKIREIEANGILTGKICQAANRSTPIANAEIIIEKDGRYVRTYSQADGSYKITLKPGTYLVTISAPGYIDFQAYATVVADERTYMETFLLVEGSEDETGIASGVITDALTGSGIEGVTLSARNGWNNTEGDVLGTAVTDSSGNYSISLPLGNYTLQAVKEGYISDSFNIIVQREETKWQNGTLTPIGQGDSYRIVLTWGENPSDLDSHVVGTLSNGNTFHVYYSDKSQFDGDLEVCNLDVDDTTSYGPETITLNVNTDRPYYYYIYRYAGSGTVASSEAQIRVYKGETPIAVYNVPTDQGSGDYWNVFAIKSGQIIVKNTITSSADISYANEEGSTSVQDILDMLEADAQKPKAE